MAGYLTEFANFLLRWLHVVAAIAWIGESIFFVMLDNRLRSPRDAADRRRGVAGEMWAVHGGGFYHYQKYATRPDELPETLHWSYWKAYATWLSGFALLALLYLRDPDVYLVNPASSWAWAAELAGWQANALALALLLGGWVAYNELCKRLSPDLRREGVLSLAVAVLMVAVAYLSTQLFAGRAAFLLTGAVMATAMSANVLFWIIPGQRRMVAAMQAGNAPDPLDGQRGKQRSVHNTYFTLPVVLLMVSNHAAFLYTHAHAWLLMALLILAGALIRQFFVLRHAGLTRPAYPLAGTVLIAAVLWLAAPAGRNVPAAASPGHEAVLAIVEKRCAPCHARAPSHDGISAPPAGVILDDPSAVRRERERIRRTVASGYMPLGNLTGMTPAERDTIAAWRD